MKVALFIRSLERGGAERQLVMLATVLRTAGVDVVVIVFYGGGPFEADLHRAGIRVVSLRKSGRWDLALVAFRLARVLNQERPDILYGFVVTPNLLGVFARPFGTASRVVWGIRSARSDLSAYDWLTRLVYWLEGALSDLPDLIIVNSKAGARQLKQRGFPSDLVSYIPNGIDVARYRRDEQARSRIRAEWRIADNEILLGMIARADPVKAHEVFLEMARILHLARPRLKFVCVGVAGPSASLLRERARQLGLEGVLRTEGPRDDMAAVYSALDVNVLSSHSEGFPNVVAEAMACGVPCAVTDAGDAREIVGATGLVAPVGDAPALAAAAIALIGRLQVEQPKIAAETRARIVENYSPDSLSKNTLAELRRLLDP